MSVSGISKVRVDRKSIFLNLKLHLVKIIVGGSSEDYGEVWFGGEGLVEVYHGDAHVGAGGYILIYIYNI